MEKKTPIFRASSLQVAAPDCLLFQTPPYCVLGVEVTVQAIIASVLDGGVISLTFRPNYLLERAPNTHQTESWVVLCAFDFNFELEVKN